MCHHVGCAVLCCAMSCCACSAPVRLTSKYRPGVPILVLTKSQKVVGACSMLRAAVTLLLGEQEGNLDRSGLVRLVS